MASDDSMTESPTLSLPLSQIRLFRPDTGDSRTLGFLYAPEASQPIRIYDAPDGSPVSWAYTSDQAEVLAREGDWAQIRTLLTSGWVHTENLYIVPPLSAAQP